MRSRFLIGWCIAAIAVFPNCSNLRAQKLSKDALSLTGTLVRVAAIKDQDKVVFKVQVSFQFRNNSDTPLLIFKPEGTRVESFVQKKVDFLETKSTLSSEQVVASSLLPWVNPYIGSDGFERFIGYLEKLNPSNSQFLVKIDPYGYYEFHDFFTIDKGYKLPEGFSKLPSKEWEDVPGIPIAEQSAFRVEYSLTVKNKTSNSELLKDLQRKWRYHGYLVLDDSGDFRVRSEPIVNK